MKILSIIFYIFFASNISVYAQVAEFDWATTTYVSGTEITEEISTDSEGYIYSIGNYAHDGDFNENSGVDSLEFIGQYSYFSNLFIKKNDKDGNHIWAKSISSEYGNDVSTILVDSNDDILIYGNIYGNTTFLPGVDTFEMNTSSSGVFILKMNSSGTVLWCKMIENVYSSKLKIDHLGHIIITGNIFDNTDLDPGLSVFPINYNIIDRSHFIVKLNTNGNFVWGKAFGSDSVGGLGIDGSNNIYISGGFSQLTDFDPGPNVETLPSPYAGEHMFILKMNENGNFIWVKGLNITSTIPWSYIYNTDLEVDFQGNSYVVGNFLGSVDFDPNSGVETLSTMMSSQPQSFILKIDDLGHYQWAKKYGSDEYSLIQSIALDHLNDIYLTGMYNSEISFINPDSLNVSITPDLISNGGSDCFLIKISNQGQFLWSKGFGSAYYDSGHHIHVDENKSIYIGGVLETSDIDSMFLDDVNDTLVLGWERDAFMIKYTQCHSQYTDYQYSCDPMTWINGITYTTSNFIAKDTLVNALGCDSIISLSYTRYNQSNETDVITTCDKILWIDGNAYTESNHTATHTLSNIYGCDSIITLDLTIGVEDNSITLDESTIIANLSGVSYQWLNCEDNYSIIPGETMQSFEPIVNGIYAVEIIQNGCIDTSLCQSVQTVSISDHNPIVNVNLYPNPSSNGFNLDLRNLKNVDIIIRNNIGQTMVFKKNISDEILKFNPKLPSGIYIMELNYNTFIHQIKFIIQ